MTPEELLLQQQQKMNGYPNAQTAAQPAPVAPPIVEQGGGETPQQFAQAKQNYTANNPAQFTNNPVGTVQYNIFKQKEKESPVVPPQNTNTGNTFNVGSYQTKPAATETGGGNYDTKGADYLSSMFTTPEEEERLRKASVARQRIAAVGDVLRHIGNLYFASQGATPQTFNNPAEEERQRYLQERAYRDKRNQMYMTYQQARAAQEAKIKQWEAQMEYNREKDAANAQALKDYRDASLKERGRQFDAGLSYRKENDEANRKQRGEHYKEQERQGRQRIGIAATNSKNAEAHRQWVRENKGKGSGSGIASLDTPKGQITPSGRNYNNQIQQMWDYAESKGLVKKSDVQKALAEAGFGKETPESVKRQQVMSLLRNNQAMADYAVNRLGWSYGSGTSSSNWDDFVEEDEDWNEYIED